MTDRFILWAQALDNTSPDHFDVYGKSLKPDDIVQRQAAVSKVSSVIKNGVKLIEKGSVLLTADASHFVIEVSSAQRDQAGRIAPIVCYGNYDTATDDSLGKSVADALDDFANRIGRTLQREHYELARSAFKTLKKKILDEEVRVHGRGSGVSSLSCHFLVSARKLAAKGKAHGHSAPELEPMASILKEQISSGFK